MMMKLECKKRITPILPTFIKLQLLDRDMEIAFFMRKLSIFSFDEKRVCINYYLIAVIATKNIL